MENGKHNRVKKNTIKPRKAKIIKDENIDISSNSNQKLLLATRIIAGVQLLILLASIVYVSFLHLLPISYLIILAIIILIITALQIFLIETKTRKIILKIISIVLSVVVAFVSIYGCILLGTLHSSIGNLPEQIDSIDTTRVNVIKEPSLIYLSGLDTRGSGEIKDAGLSDVNMVIAVNPKTKKILMINIPRDYYVGLDGDANKLDKLTHAGNKGVSCSMKTVGALFDIDFNYYIKVNFKSVVDIVDVLGGVTVNSDFDFTSAHSLSGKSYSFNVGENTLTGDAALAFARERKCFANGDRQRGIHQQKVINGVIDKLISPSLLNPMKISSILGAVTNNIKTNISSTEISSLVQMQLGDMSTWDVQTYSVDGTGAMKPCYSTGNQKLSVMIPKQETVEEAKLKIQEVIS